MYFCQREFVHHHRTEGVEEDLEGTKEGFSQNRVEKDSLKGCREVGVEAINAKRFMVGEVIWLDELSIMLSSQHHPIFHTLKEALYGIPIGRLAKTAKTRFANGNLNARLWDISWMARKRFWFAVAPIMYAVRKKGHEKTGVFRSKHAQKI